MFKNRFLLLLAVLSLGLITMAVAQPYSSASPAQPMDPIAYFDRSDYYFRHPELRAPSPSMDLTDYFFRHLELSGK